MLNQNQASSGAGNQAAMPWNPQSPQGRLAELNVLVAGLQADLNDLRAHLAPVLNTKPRVVDNTKPVSEVRPAGSKFREELASLCDRVEALRTAAQDLRDDVDL